MKKHIFVSLLAFILLVAPSVSSALEGNGPGDVDPNPNTVACISITHDLRYRSRDITTGGEVSDLQDLLQSQGYLNSEPTGYFGLLTQAAVKKFQSANGINPTGYVGPLTRARIHVVTCDTEGPVEETPVPTPAPTPTPTPTVAPGCPPSALYNFLTGQPCSTTPPTPTPFPGSALSILTPERNGSYSSTLPFLSWKSSPVNTTDIYYVELKSVSVAGHYSGEVLAAISLSGAGAQCSAENVCHYPLLTLYPQIFSPGGTYSVLVKNSQNSSSDSIKFTVSGNTTTSSISVLSPNGGEYLTKGTTQTIKWKDVRSVCTAGVTCSSPAPVTYDIFLVRYSDSSTRTIAKAVSGFSYDWTIPNCTATNPCSSNFEIPADAYTIQVCQTGTDLSHCDSSDSYFKVISGTVASEVTSFTAITVDADPSYGGTVKRLDWTTKNVNGVNLITSSACPYGLTITEAANQIPETPFYCGDVNRRTLNPNGSIYLRFINTTGTTISTKLVLSPDGDTLKSKNVIVNIPPSTTIYSDATIKANLANSRPIAELYYDTHNSYLGVCSASPDSYGISALISAALAAGAGKVYSPCNDSATAWAASIKLRTTDAGYWCVDSNGTSKSTQVDKGTATHCPESITTPPPNQPPKITSVTPAPSNPQTGQKISFTWTATDVDNDDLNWHVDWGDGSPSGVVCPGPSQNKQNWSHSESHTYQSGGQYLIKASVTDCQGTGDVTSSFGLNVGSTASFYISTASPLPNSTLGVNYFTRIETVGIVGGASWGTTGTLPAGIAYMDPPAGTTCANLCYYLGGTPTGPGGAYNFTYWITSGSQTVSKQFVLWVIDPSGVGYVPSASKVLGASTYHFTQELKIGDVGNEVTELQKYLQSHGYSAGPVDGIFGDTLKRAVVDFQTSMGIWADGIVGPSTRAILNQ